MVGTIFYNFFHWIYYSTNRYVKLILGLLNKARSMNGISKYTNQDFFDLVDFFILLLTIRIQFENENEKSKNKAMAFIKIRINTLV